MEWLVWAGAGVTLLGLAGLVWCILRVAGARRAGLSDAELRARLQRVVALNLGALLLSALGLVMVVAGIALG
ncbi:MAG: hypothetical protein N2Z62_11165 [Rhodobacteraceae bacterium]|nr:hypothetical protein [Paracoccaceae bacterium]